MFELTKEITATLAPDEIHRVESWLIDLRMVANASNKEQAKTAISMRRGCSVSKVTKYFYGVRDNGPEYLIDGRKHRRSRIATQGHQSPLFIQWVHSLYYQCKRLNATPTVQGLMLQRLAAWESAPHNMALAIPGYDSPPARSKQSRFRHPYGWSLRNLNDIKPTGYEAALAGQGPHKARDLLPGVYTTRIGLHVGEVYMLDDQYLDVMVHYGQKVVRPIGLNILDLFSGCDVQRIVRPLLKDEEDGQKALNQRDALWLAVSLLTHVGYHPEKCVLVAEAGAATYPEFFRNGIGIITDGKVSVDVGEVSKREVAGLRMIAKGNPRFKAARESWFNLLRNRMSMLPMQVGRDRDHKPEETIRLEQEEAQLHKLAAKLPETVRHQIEMEGLPWDQFGTLYHSLCEAINQRTDHSLEGWEKLGFEYTEFLLGDQWIDTDEYRQIAPETRALINDRMRRGETVSRVSRRSPREVFQKDAPTLSTISPFRWHYVIPQEFAFPVTVPDNRTLKIDRREYGPEPLLFEPEYYTESGERKALRGRQKALAYINPLRPDFALLCDLDSGKAIGIVFALQKSTRLDKDYMLEQFQKLRRVESEIGGSAARHNDVIGEERKARRARNKALLQQHGIHTREAPKKKGKKKPQNNAPRQIETKEDDTGEDDFLTIL